MAIMIPEKPRNFAPASQEGLIFDALALLSEDYYVFHSFRITDTREGVFQADYTLSPVQDNKIRFTFMENTFSCICDSE